MKDKATDKLTDFLPYILLVIGLSVLLLSLAKKKTVTINGVESSDMASVRRLTDERVNRYLKDAYNKKQLEQVRAKNEIDRNNPIADVPRQGEVRKSQAEEYSGGDIESEDRWSTTADPMGVMTPEEMIQYQLKFKQEENLRSQQEREAFIQQFIENARRNGLEVQIDQNLKVRSVKKIRP